jgi:predicted Zn-dependent peptidase
MLNRTIEPHIVNAVDFELTLPKPNTIALNNGIMVHSIHSPNQQVVMLELVFYAGNWYEENNIVAASTNFLLKNGTTTKTAFEISETFEQYGAYLNRNCYNETATITLHCLSKHLPLLIPALHDIVTKSVFKEEELAIYVQNQIQRLNVNLKKCDFVANRLIDEYLYGIHHPYGKYTSTQDYEALNTTQIKSFITAIMYTVAAPFLWQATLPPKPKPY